MNKQPDSPSSRFDYIDQRFQRKPGDGRGGITKPTPPPSRTVPEWQEPSRVDEEEESSDEEGDEDSEEYGGGEATEGGAGHVSLLEVYLVMCLIAAVIVAGYTVFKVASAKVQQARQTQAQQAKALGDDFQSIDKGMQDLIKAVGSNSVVQGATGKAGSSKQAAGKDETKQVTSGHHE